MSTSLFNDLKASLEDQDTAYEGTDQQLASDIAELQADAPERNTSLSEALSTQADANALADSFDQIATRAEEVIGTDNADVAIEHLAFGLTTLMASKGVRHSGASMESLTSVATTARTMSRNVRKASQVSMEATFRELQNEIEGTVDDTVESAGLLQQAIARIASKAKDIEANGVVLNHKGVYQFLHRDGKPLPTLAGAMAPDLKVIKDLIATAREIHDQYEKLAKDIIETGDDINGLRKVVANLLSFDSRKLLKRFQGIKTLNNGYFEVITGGFEDDDYEAMEIHPHLYWDWGMAAGDGSKAPLKERVAGALKGGLSVGVVGAAVGGMMATVPGMVIGGAIGAIAGAAAGKNASDYQHQGGKTNSTTSVKDMIQFLKDIQSAAKLVWEVNDLLDSAYDDSSRVDKLFGMMAHIGDMDSDDNVTKFLSAFSSAMTGVSGSSPATARLERLTDVLRQKTDEMYAAHMSLLDAAAEIANNAVDNGLTIARTMLK